MIRIKRHTRWVILVITLLLIAGTACLWQTDKVHAAGNSLEVKYLNIEGDSTFMLSTSGSTVKSVIIDAGSTRDKLINQLRQNDIYSKLKNGVTNTHLHEKVIDYMFITHAHSDHTNGLKALLESSSAEGGNGFVIRNLYVNCVVGTDNNTFSEIKALVNKYSGKIAGEENTSSTHIKNKIINTRYVGTNGTSSATHLNSVKNIAITDGLKATILPNLKKDEKINNCSMMLKFRAGNSNFIFAGDLLKRGIKEVLNNSSYKSILSGSSGDSVYFKMPHHAARRLNGDGFVTNLEMGSSGTISDLKNRGEKVANYFTRTDSTKGIYSYKNAQGKVFTGIKNYDEAFNKMIKGSSKKLIGIGNMRDVSDTSSIFAMIGLDEYRDVRPTDYATNLRNLATKGTSWGAPQVSSSEVTYKVVLNY